MAVDVQSRGYGRHVPGSRWRRGQRRPRRTTIVTSNRKGHYRRYRAPVHYRHGHASLGHARFVRKGGPKAVPRSFRSPTKGERQRGRLKAQRQVAQAELIRQFHEGGLPHNSYPFLKALVGRKERMEDSPLKNILWSHQARNLFGTQRGVDVANIRTQFEDLWGRAHGLYPKGKRPKLAFSPSGDGSGASPSALAFALKGPQAVVVTPGGSMQMGDAIRPSSVLSKSERHMLLALPLHEWAHLHQSQHGGYRHSRDEGGAEAFAQLTAPRFGYRYRRTKHDPYQRFANKARRKGRRYVLQGQFR